ncbi:hypothetical protein ACERZ8_01210 [Tateyamaria armeniaca]|uniref:Uncharacterized protein n=1 Tax=Tateyamaria armeniaca TaxID=2518930 RepID=A0ABW8UN60_9RHOB
MFYICSNRKERRTWMSYHARQPGLFDPAQGALPIETLEPATEKQIAFARTLAARTGTVLPTALLRNKAGLSQWIDRAKLCAARQVLKLPQRPAGAIRRTYCAVETTRDSGGVFQGQGNDVALDRRQQTALADLRRIASFAVCHQR